MEYRYINKETGLGGNNGTWGKKGRERYLPTHDYNPDDNGEYSDGIYGAGGYRHCGRFCNLENKPSDFPIAPCYVKNAESKVDHKMTKEKRRELILLILDKNNNDKFSKEQINAIKILNEEYVQTEMYKNTLAERQEWIDTASANDIWLHICEKICEAPMIAGAILRIMIPVLWEKVQQEY